MYTAIQNSWSLKSAVFAKMQKTVDLMLRKHGFLQKVQKLKSAKNAFSSKSSFLKAPYTEKAMAPSRKK